MFFRWCPSTPISHVVAVDASTAPALERTLKAIEEAAVEAWAIPKGFRACWRRRRAAFLPWRCLVRRGGGALGSKIVLDRRPRLEFPVSCEFYFVFRTLSSRFHVELRRQRHYVFVARNVNQIVVQNFACFLHRERLRNIHRLKFDASNFAGIRIRVNQPAVSRHNPLIVVFALPIMDVVRGVRAIDGIVEHRHAPSAQSRPMIPANSAWLCGSKIDFIRL